LVIDATVNEFHVVIDSIRREDAHTLPTNMHRALRTSHMIATSVLLDRDLALRALLDVLTFLNPILQQLLSCFRIPMYLPLLAAEPVVLLLAGHANGHEARLAPENSISGIRFERVDLWTVRSGAVFELLGMVTKVFEEGDFQQVLELSGREEPLYDRKWDRDTALPLIAHTRQGELFGVGGGDKKVTKASATINVATSEAVRFVDCVVTNRTDFPVPELVLRSTSVGE